MHSIEVAPLVRRAAAGEDEAWSELVDRYGDLVWSVARSCGLDGADAADVSQTTWLRLAENLPRLRQPDSVGYWLATTARREAMAVARRGKRQIPSGVLFEREPATEDGHPDVPVLRRERDEALSDAFARLPESCRRLLGVLLREPTPSYAQVSEVLAIPIGSIGPQRARCLDRLRIDVERRDDDHAYRPMQAAAR